MVNAAQCHGKARERKGSARKEKGRAAEKERKKKMGMERMREFTLWRIFEITNYNSQALACLAQGLVSVYVKKLLPAAGASIPP